MKKVIGLFTLLTIFAMGNLCFAANTASGISDSAERGYISVYESETREINPNKADIRISIISSDSSLVKASSVNKQASTNVYKAISDIVKTDGIVKTGAYSIAPKYSYTKDKKRVLDKFVVTNTIFVSTKNINSVSQIIDASISKGATQIEDLKFSSTDYEGTYNDLLALLTKKAYNRANVIAKSVGAQVVGIKSVNSSYSQNSDGTRSYLMNADSGFSEQTDMETPIISGKIKLNASVNASFYVK